MRIGLLCGGPSLERGISLNSARSVLDHLGGNGIEIVPVYLDHTKKAYAISTAQLYSNTPSDFDFKLARSGTPLAKKELITLLKKMDIVFPAMHGPFGEDGGVQQFLEQHNIPFVGTGSKACKQAFDKYLANEFIRSQGFFAPPSIVLKIYGKDHAQVVRAFFESNGIKRAIVKPATGGSSIGVFSVTTVDEALEKANILFSKRMDTRVVIEPFMEGREFTTIVLQNKFGLPVTILPTEIETDYTENQIFDFRKKYLPTRQVTHHCPPRFSNEIIEKIQIQAEHLFSALDMRDFARFDGWVLDTGEIWFSDFNPISGMEQNSFIFQQASRVGMSHRDILRFVVRTALRRYGKDMEPPSVRGGTEKKEVRVLFGSVTSERQVSLMSGTNVWLKLLRSETYRPVPFLLDTKKRVWELPYAYTLNHTVEEIMENCECAKEAQERLQKLQERVGEKLALEPRERSNVLTELPKSMSLESFLKGSAFVFNALHGGEGEDGTLQALMEKKGIRFNGSGSAVSRLCMDKWDTGRRVNELAIPGVSAIPGVVVQCARIEKDPNIVWRDLEKELSTKAILVKPRSDGCSSGIVCLHNAQDLAVYVRLVRSGVPHIQKGTFRDQYSAVEMPTKRSTELLFERFVETDTLRVKGNHLKHHARTGWIEATVGLLERDGTYDVFDPSITIAQGGVLSVEEKFQGGTGVNITPPPEHIMSGKVVKCVKERIEVLAQKIGLTGYARIDIFMHRTTGDVLIIEVNTLPALTPSTVLYQQALGKKHPMYPRDLLERIIESAGY